MKDSMHYQGIPQLLRQYMDWPAAVEGRILSPDCFYPAPGKFASIGGTKRMVIPLPLIRERGWNARLGEYEKNRAFTLEYPVKANLCFYGRSLLLLLLDLGKALAAVNRTILTGLEGNAGFLAASSANRGEHLSLGSLALLAGVAAGFASLGLVGEASLSVELLLAGGEDELFAALFAH